MGTLALTPEGTVAFQYTPPWISEGFAISPLSLPLDSAVRVAKAEPLDGLHGIFADSLPDGWGRLLVDRRLARHGVNPATTGPLARLAIVGANGMGALRYEPEQPIATDLASFASLDAAAKACEQVLAGHADASPDALDRLHAAGGSSGGARPKIFLEDDEGSWIVKSPSSADPPSIGAMEYEYSLAARTCGIDMPETRLLPSQRCEGYFATRRFDRSGTQRIHMASAAALLETSHRVPNPDYVTLGKLTRILTGSMAEVARLYRLMCVNVFAHNQDDHSKNFTFRYIGDSWSLSPAYDLTYSTSFGNEHAATVAGAGNPQLDDVLAAAREMGLAPSKARSTATDIRAIAAPLAAAYA